MTSRLEPYRFTGGVAVLTGAASGMGEQMAYQLAMRGSHMVLVDRDADRLGDVAARIAQRRPEIRVTTLVADLSDAAAVTKVAADVLASEPSISLLINNAGVALAGTFEDASAEDFDWVMAGSVVLPHA